jgi:hypothetical protein
MEDKIKELVNKIDKQIEVIEENRVKEAVKVFRRWRT